MSVVSKPTNLPEDNQRRGTTTATLIIPSRVAHRRTLKDYFVKDGTSAFSDISLGNVTILRIWDSLAQAILVSDLNHRFMGKGFLSYMAERIADFPFPNASQDEAITIARDVAPDRIDAYFEDQTEGDVTSRELPGGSLSKKQFLVINLDNTDIIAADGDYFLDTLDMPTGLTPFSEGTDIVAGGRRIAPGQKLTLYAVAGNFPKFTASKTTRIHINDEKIELFSSENQEGLFVDPDFGNELEFDLAPLKMFWLKTPYDMKPNNLFTFKGTADHDGANDMDAHSQKLFLICTREILGA